MAAGAPVLTSSVSSLPEVVGDAAVLVDPRSSEAIADGLRRLLTDPGLAAQLRERGRARAAGFSWERTARETLALLRGLAARR
jgi:alpha-1,3-rhamnosyl/mannosyltransferase